MRPRARVRPSALVNCAITVSRESPLRRVCASLAVFQRGRSDCRRCRTKLSTVLMVSRRGVMDGGIYKGDCTCLTRPGTRRNAGEGLGSTGDVALENSPMSIIPSGSRRVGSIAALVPTVPLIDGPSNSTGRSGSRGPAPEKRRIRRSYWARIFCFSCWNSSSVRAPICFNSASSLS